MTKTLIATAALAAALVTTSANADIVCTERGCWETGVRIIAVDPSYVRGQPLISYRNGRREVLRSVGVAEETTPCQFCGQNNRRR